MEDDYRTSSNFHRYINIVDIRVTCTPSTIQCIYDLGIHDFDRAMEKFSIGLAQDLMAEKLISKVSVNITISGFTTHTDK